MKNIIFTPIEGFPKEIVPIPAIKEIPQWYKDTDSYTSGIKKPNGNAHTSGTIKRCIPVLDAMTAGYILPLPADIYVSMKEVDGEITQWFEWANFDLIAFHPVEQAPLHPERKNYPFAKFNNPWSIRTPSGYSCLFVQPFHRDAPFTILPGIVDTDTYSAQVNFPMVINDPNFEGLIPKGIPMVQVIPFKRESWVMGLGDNEELAKATMVKNLLSSKFFDRYKNMFWHKKSFK
jgi:hypothetical protein